MVFTELSDVASKIGIHYAALTRKTLQYRKNLSTASGLGPIVGDELCGGF